MRKPYQYGAGELDHTIIIDTYGTTKDAFGQEVKTWSTLATVPAKKEDMLSTSTMAVEEAAQEQTKTITKFTIRYLSTLNGNCRIKVKGEVYKIVRIAERGRKRYQEIIAYMLDSDILE